MVKTDLSRDYYGDLELEPGASDNDIKKQFKKLALKYHPDRNPGREAEVNSKFQTIQSAHEVLTDPEQKAKYDASLSGKGAARAYSYGNSTPGPSSGSAQKSHARGNPYSSAGSYWPPPPKPPPVRKPQQPSAGAQRYEKFQPAGGPKRQEDPAEERKKTFQAYETMRSQGPKREWQPPKPVDPKFTQKSGREESNSFKHPPPPKSSRPGFDEFRAGVPPPPRMNRKSSSPPSPDRNASAPPRRNGFTPSNLSGDEPPASNTSAYFTHRQGRTTSTQQAKPPDLPSRRSPNLDPLSHVKEQVGTAYEERVSTPYATLGGEKTNPFETLHRSKSTRERSDKVELPDGESVSADESRRSTSQPRTRRHRTTVSSEFGPRVSSETNLGSPQKRSHPYARNSPLGEPSRAKARYTPTPTAGSETSSDGEEQMPTHQSFGTQSRNFAKKRTARQTEWSQDSPIAPGKPTSSMEANDTIPRKPSLSGFRQRELFEAAKRNVLNDLQPDGPRRTHTTGRDESGREATNPSMYGNPKKSHSSYHPMASYVPIYETDKPTINLSKASTFPTVSEKKKVHRSNCAQKAVPFATASSEAYSSKWPNLFPPKMKLSTPNALSGASLTHPTSLNAFETAQFELLNELVVNRSGVDRPSKVKKLSKKQSSEEHIAKESLDKSRPSNGIHSRKASTSMSSDNRRFVPSSSKEIRGRHKFGHASDLRSYSEQAESSNFFRGCIVSCSSVNANGNGCTSFTFNVGDEMFTATSAPRPFASSSAENVNTAFSPDDWHGKFQAGEDYFGGDSSAGARRPRSGSRSRGRSPVKPRRTQVNTRSQYTNIDPGIIDGEKPAMSPKFSAEEWAHTFKQQTFAPPTRTSRSTHAPRVSRRTRVGSAAGKPLFGSMTAGNAAMVDESESSEDNLLYMGQRRRSHSNPLNAASPNAMDIDPPLETEARNVQVEPSRPEWRAGDTNGIGAETVHAPGVRPKLPARDAAKQRRRSTKPDDSDDFKTNLNDLKNVEPLHHPATGLNSFGDLNSTLPFTSQAASSVPISRNIYSGQIDLPKPPRAPMLPSIARDAPRPSQSSWQSYLTEFKAYMAHWTTFNTSIIAHFTARRDQIDSMPAGWIEAFGGSSVEKYKEGLKEDVKVREWWDVASTKHMAAIEEFMWCREVMKEGVQAAGGRPANTY